MLKPAILMVLFAVFSMMPVQAAGVVGSGTPASCTEAALDAALAGGGAVSFNCGGAPHTIAITLPIEIDSDTRIDGGGLITLRGSGSLRLMRIYETAVELNGLTLENGFAGEHDGGAIYNDRGTLTITNSRFVRNRAYGAGGAIFNNNGVVAISRSTFNGNRALNWDGGSIFNYGGTLDIAGSTFIGNTSHNYGGAIANGGGNWTTIPQSADGGAVSISGSRFLLNMARLEGGAFFSQAYGRSAISDSLFGLNLANNGGGAVMFRPGRSPAGETPRLEMTNSRFLTNVSLQGAAVYNVAAEMTIAGSWFEGNVARWVGGALVNHTWGDARGSVTVVDTTFRRNRARYGGGVGNIYGEMRVDNSLFESNLATTGGGLFNGEVPAMLIGDGPGRLWVHNATFSGNRAAEAGGGFTNADPGGFNEFAYVTFANNSAANGNSLAGGSIRLGKVILYAPGNGPNCAEPVRDAFASLQFPGRSCGGPAESDPLLGPLADNGGPTRTHALLNGSPAIDAVPSAGGGQLCDEGIDQRYFERPSNGSGIAFALCDIGAYEYQEFGSASFPLVNATPAPTLPVVPTLAPTATPSRTPPPPQVDCQTFRATSPRDGFPNGTTTFYWDAAPGATEYRVSITNERGELVASYSVAAPSTSLSADVSAGAIGGGFSFTWEVQALLNGQPMCRDGVQLYRESPPGQPGGSSSDDDDDNEPNSQPQCGNGIQEPGETPNTCPNGY